MQKCDQWPSCTSSGWHPIETAPKDGAWIDLWVVGPRSSDGYREPNATWNKPTNSWVAPYGRDGLLPVGAMLGDQPTHWREIPEGPTCA